MAKITASRIEGPEQVDAALAALPGPWCEPDLQATFWRYYRAEQTDPAQETLIRVDLDDSPALFLPAVENAVGLGCFGRPSSPIWLDRRIEGQFADALDAALTCLNRPGEISFAAPPAPLMRVAGLDPDQIALQGQAQAHGFVDLSLDLAGIKRNLRKSYKSLVNWGQREIAVKIITGDQASDEVFDQFRLFHAQVAGRVTRPKSSWDEMQRLTRDGRALLVVGHLDGALLATTFIVHNGLTALYASGVYDREKFDKPVAHWPLVQSFLALGPLGPKILNLGETGEIPGMSDKEISIAFFKKGFASELADRIVTRL